jgi:hypothetical protein
MSVNWHPETAEAALGMYIDVLIKIRCLRKGVSLPYVIARVGTGRFVKILRGKK